MSQTIFSVPKTDTGRSDSFQLYASDPNEDTFSVTLDITNATVEICCTNDPRAETDAENAAWKVVESWAATDTKQIPTLDVQYWCFNVPTNSGSVQGWVNTVDGRNLKRFS